MVPAKIIKVATHTTPGHTLFKLNVELRYDEIGKICRKYPRTTIVLMTLVLTVIEIFILPFLITTQTPTHLSPPKNRYPGSETVTERVERECATKGLP